VVVTEEVEVDEVAYLGDSTPRWIVQRENFRARRAKLVIMECTYLDNVRSVSHARKHGHTHLFDLLSPIPEAKVQARSSSATGSWSSGGADPVNKKLSIMDSWSSDKRWTIDEAGNKIVEGKRVEGIESLTGQAEGAEKLARQAEGVGVESPWEERFWGVDSGTLVNGRFEPQERGGEGTTLFDLFSPDTQFLLTHFSTRYSATDINRELDERLPPRLRGRVHAFLEGQWRA